MISSIDGRLLPGRWTKPVDGNDQNIIGKHYDQVADRLEADGWMVGRTSMADYANGKPHPVLTSDINLREVFIGNRNGRNVAVAIDLKGKLHYDQDEAEGNHIIAILGNDVPDDYLGELRQDGISYLMTDDGPTGMEHAMDVLGDVFGIKSIMLQGGGVTNGHFLKAGLIDEMSLLIYPGIDGLSGIPSIFDYHGESEEKPAQGQTLRFLNAETLENGLLWVRYEFSKEISQSSDGL